MHNRIYYLIISLALFLVAGVSSYAGTGTTDGTNFPVKGVWPGGTVAKNTTVYISGTVWVKTPIIIPAGKTLTISLDENVTESVRIRPHKDFAPTDDGPNRLFEILSEGKLVIKGLQNGKEVFIKANALQYSTNQNPDPNAVLCDEISLPSPYASNDTDLIYGTTEYNTAFEAVKAKTINWGKRSKDYKPGAVIIATGTLEMTWARIYDAYSTGPGAAIARTHESDGDGARIYGKITLTHCHITQNYGQEGCAIYVQNQTKNGNTPSSCLVTLTDCLIADNVAKTSKGGAGGVIRTGGGAVGSIKMVRTEVKNNYCYGDGIVYWNANGKEETTLTFNGCSIHHNNVTNDGGGVVIEGSYQFEGTKSQIYNNKAGRNGGGVWIVPYNGGANVQATSVDMTFSNLVSIKNNEAIDGGGIYAEIRDNTTFDDGMDINLIISGAEISSNTASNNGGGVFFRHANAKLDVAIRVESGTISDNKTTKYGGGVYCELAEGVSQNNCQVYFNGGTISGNEAQEGSGGGISVYGLKVQCASNASGITITGNKALKYYGGGIHLEKGASFTMNSGTVTDNSSENYGGGVFVRDSEMIQNGGVISNNTSNVGGGGVYIRGQDASASYSASSGTISGNTAELSGGGIYMSKNSTATISGGEIYGNTANTQDGGGIFCVGTLTIKGNCAIGKSGSPNKAPSTTAEYGCGGGVSISSVVDNGVTYVGSCTVAGGSVSYNESGRHGAGIYTKGAIKVEGGVISNNTSSQYGGGLYVDSGEAQVSIDGGTISDNKARYGAGVFVQTGVCEISGGSVDKNTASVGGGGVTVYSTVYVKGNASITGNAANGVANSNNTSGGGGVLVASGAKFYMSGNSVISENTCVDTGAGIRARSGAVEIVIEDGDITSNTAEVSGGGLALYGGNLTLSGGRVSGNKSTNNNGGGLYLKIPGKKATIIGGNVTGNTAGHIGGGVYVEAGSFEISKGEISGNKAGGNGGGINFNSADGTFVISGGKVSDNEVTVGHGGGIYVARGSLSITGGEISGNNLLNASYNGAGINFNSAEEGTLTIEDGIIEGNSSLNFGGGVYVAKGTMVFNDGVIRDNSAVKSGGGICFVGRLLTINNGDIINNTASTNGGGLCVWDNSSDYVTTAIMQGGDIHGNEAKVCGGGVYLENAAKFDFSGGNIYDNSALIGGAICDRGGVLSFTGGSITNNVARCGGGIFLSDSGTQMTFGNGLIRNNKAVDGSGHTLTTGYGYHVSGGALALQGTGGGIYIQNGASMSFTSEDVGIYANSADTMADDIYSNGSNGASITLPDVSSMNLSGYNSRTSELYWVEDYMTGDTGYSNGTAIAGASHSAVRYRDAIAAQSTVYPLQATKLGSYSGKYLALSIGYEVIYVTLQRTGLQAGESAIYRIFRIDDGVPSVYSEVLLTGSAGAPVQSKRVALYSGKWRVEETLWTWTYVTPAAIERDITGSTDAPGKVFSFGAAKKESVPEHAEDIVVNDFGEGTAVSGSYINSGSINDLQNTTDYQLK